MVDTPMPLTAHLTDLRSRLVACVLAIAVGFALCYAAAVPGHLTHAGLSA